MLSTLDSSLSPFFLSISFFRMISGLSDVRNVPFCKSTFCKSNTIFFFDFQYEKIIFNCQPSHFSPCSAVPVLVSFQLNGRYVCWGGFQKQCYCCYIKKSIAKNGIYILICHMDRRKPSIYQLFSKTLKGCQKLIYPPVLDFPEINDFSDSNLQYFFWSSDDTIQLAHIFLLKT